MKLKCEYPLMNNIETIELASRAVRFEAFFFPVIDSIVILLYIFSLHIIWFNDVVILELGAVHFLCFVSLGNEPFIYQWKPNNFSLGLEVLFCFFAMRHSTTIHISRTKNQTKTWPAVQRKNTRSETVTGELLRPK